MFFSLPILLNVNLFGNYYIEPDGSSRIWPPWGDGTGPVAGLASLTLIICVYFFFKKRNIPYIIAVFITTLAILNLASRGSIIGLLICLGIYVLLHFLKFKKQRKWLIIMIFTVLFLSPNIENFNVISNLTQRFQDFELILSSQKRSGRIFVVIATINSFLDRPFTGGGTGSFNVEISKRISDFDLLTRIHGRQLGDAHSFLFQNIFEHGLLGILLVLNFYFLSIKASFKHQNKYGGILMILIFFFTFYSFTTAFKHAVMFVPYILIILEYDKNSSLMKNNHIS